MTDFKPVPWTWPERIFLRSWPVLAILFVLLYAIALAYLLEALHGTPQNSVTISDSVTSLLALGTLTLAYAAVAQGILAARRHRAEVTSCLQIEIQRRWVDQKSDEERWIPVVASPFKVDVPPPADEKFRFVVHNFGPGAALAIRVQMWEWNPTSLPTDVKIEDTPPDRKGTPVPRTAAELLSLQPGASQDFQLEIVLPNDQLAKDGKLPFMIRRQTVISAEGVDIEGRRIWAPDTGLLHISFVPDQTRPSEKASTSWALLNGTQARALKNLSAKKTEVSYAAPLFKQSEQ